MIICAFEIPTCFGYNRMNDILIFYFFCYDQELTFTFFFVLCACNRSASSLVPPSLTMPSDSLQLPDGKESLQLQDGNSTPLQFSYLSLIILLQPQILIHVPPLPLLTTL